MRIAAAAVAMAVHHFGRLPCIAGLQHFVRYGEVRATQGRVEGQTATEGIIANLINQSTNIDR